MEETNTKDKELMTKEEALNEILERLGNIENDRL